MEVVPPVTDAGTPPGPGVVRFGLFELDQRAGTLRRDGALVRLQPQPFRVLALLATRSGEVVTRDEIRRAVWGEGTPVDFDQGLGFCLSQIRAALGDSAHAPHYIQTLPRRGYRFLLPVQEGPSTSRKPRRRLPALVGGLAALGIGIGAAALATRPSTPPARRLAEGRRVDPEVYQLVLRGRYFWNRRTADSFRHSLRLFEEAARRDASYAPAWSGIAQAWVGLADHGYVPTDEAAPHAREAVARALSLDPSLAEAHAVSACIAGLFDRDGEAARRHFDQAILLNPSYAPAHQWLSHLFHEQGRTDDALAQARIAFESDPVSVAISDNLADSLLLADRAEEALLQVDRTIELDPAYAPAHLNRGRALLKLRRVDQALVAFDRAASLGVPSAVVRTYRAVALASVGRRAEARRTLATLGGARGDHYERAMVLSALGDAEEALTELDRSIDAGEPASRWILADETLQPLRAHPRMAALVRKLGLVS